jgi:hypothetical protein
MVFNATFNIISVISWRSVLLVEETGVPGENHRPAESGVKHHNPEHLFLIFNEEMSYFKIRKCKIKFLFFLTLFIFVEDE